MEAHKKRPVDGDAGYTMYTAFTKWSFYGVFTVKQQDDGRGLPLAVTMRCCMTARRQPLRRRNWRSMWPICMSVMALGIFRQSTTASLGRVVHG